MTVAGGLFEPASRYFLGAGRQGEIDIVEPAGMGTESDRSQWTGNIHGPSATNNSVDVKL